MTPQEAAELQKNASLTVEQRAWLQKQSDSYVADKQPGFDLRTNINTPTGEGNIRRDYFIHLIGGEKLYEFPAGSGNLFYANNAEAGRISYTKEANGKLSPKVDKEAEHEEVREPQSADAVVFAKLEETKMQNEALQKELAALREEKALEEKVAAAKVTKAESKTAKEETK